MLQRLEMSSVSSMTTGIQATVQPSRLTYSGEKFNALPPLTEANVEFCPEAGRILVRALCDIQPGYYSLQNQLWQ